MATPTQRENNDPNMPASDKPKRGPEVRLHASIRDRKGAAETEVIRKIKSNSEVVDVDGFVFIRKRKASANSSTDSHKKSKPQTPTAELLPAMPASSNTAAAANGPTTPQALGQPESTGSEQVAQATEDTGAVEDQANGTATPNLLGGVVPQATPARQEAELVGVVYPSFTSANTPAASDVADLAVASAEEGAQEPVTFRVFADPGEVSEDEHATAERLLAQLPTGVCEADRLLALCNLLLEESLKLLVQDPSPATQAAADLMRATLTTFTHSVSEALGNGTLLPVEPDSEASAAAELEAERVAERAALQAQLQAFQQEEQEWEEVLKEAKAVNSTSLEPAALANETEAISTEPTPNHDAAGVLQQAQADAHRKLTVQVEGLVSMVNGVEELVAKAEKHCSILQAEYHKEKFRTFPHVDSPARLIRDIVRPRRPTAL